MFTQTLESEKPDTTGESGLLFAQYHSKMMKIIPYVRVSLNALGTTRQVSASMPGHVLLVWEMGPVAEACNLRYSGG